ncbi:hypothetical protein GUITHDRAFT_114610 [Guillardia theta CCMP2712]|uniref:Telomere length regulation protein conserved domain-containing protein n=1 Tax=Guillardia theta (strain CCMP2712) TaxID=905079 RepID=L1ISU6_GUITC|nr:hypothetical protein GUITHDRAFT_114610 [Guillardia theta CCMP2712]EKX39182.1 hypothetical protein GUITHDRAFT_114610 [Guillardia theta CCMP2712]|eukprot:XP_005826162.1 hypothetical protein GUITHDRAFT_114610 [Guillardia theta CCMP2712]
MAAAIHASAIDRIELESLSKLAGLVSDKDEERRREFFCLRRYIPFIVKLSSKIGENYLSLLSEEERSKCYDVFFISKFIEGAGPSLLGLNNALKQSGNSFTINYHCNLIQTWFSSGGITNFMRDLMDQSAAGENEEDAEQVLVSLPDRIGNKLDGKVPKFFHPKEYFPFLLTACLRFLEETPIQVGEEDEDSLVALKPCLAFAGSLFGKMAITGQSQLSATWLLRHLVVAEEDKGPEEGSKVSSSIVDEVTAKKRMVEETLSKYNKRRSIIIARNILGNLKSRHLDTFLHHLISSAPSDLVGERPTLGEGRVNSLVVDLVAPMCFEDERVRDLLFRELMINRVSLQRGCKERILLMVLSTDYLEMSRYEGKRSNLYAVTRSLSELFASESYTKTRDEEHQSRHAMGGRAAIEEAQVVTFVLEAIQLRLAGHVDWMRRHGMQLAEQFSIIWNPDNPIKFEEDEASSLPHAQDASEPHQDERKGRNGSISQGQPNDGEVTVEEDKEKKKKTRPKRRRQQTSGRRKWQACQDPDRIILSSASESESEEEGGSDSCTDEEEAGGPAARASHLIDDGDSDSDDGLVPYQVEESELENCFARQAAVEERDVESDLVPLRYGEGRVSLPTNLRQCLRGLTSQNPDEVCKK